MTIHPSAFIHPTAIVSLEADIGPGAVIGPGVIIERDVVIGAYSVIGGPPEHRSFMAGEPTRGVVIHPGCRIYEFVTIHAGILNPTVLWPHAAVFNHSHVAHDCELGVGTIVGGQVSLAGHTVLMTGSTVSGKSCTHQWAVLGPYAFLSAASFLKGAVPPGEIWIGNPARPAGLNEVGMHRVRTTHEEVLNKWGVEFDHLVKERKLCDTKPRKPFPIA